MSTGHTPGAIRAAEAITRCEYLSPKMIKTAYGTKTTKGIADLIDRETAAPELLEALRGLVNIVTHPKANRAACNVIAQDARALLARLEATQ